MLHKAFNPQDGNTLPNRATATKERCQHRTRSGRQCRTSLTSAHATLCPRHAAAQRDDSADLSALLAGNLSEQKSAADIHAQLWNLSLALQQGRISPRRAAVLAYINSLLLRTLPAIDKQESAEDEELDMTGAPRPIRNPRIIIDIPGAVRHFDDDGQLIPDPRSNRQPDFPSSYSDPNASGPELDGLHSAPK